MPTPIRIVHDPLPGRVRFEVPSLARREAACSRVVRALSRLHGVEEVRANRRTATVLVRFSPAEHDIGSLARRLSDWLADPAALERASQGTNVGKRGASGEDAQSGEPTKDEDGPEMSALDASDVLVLFDVRLDTGLRASEADARLERDGGNALRPAPRRNEVAIFFDQLKSTPVALLGASAVFSAATGGLADALAILTVVGLNATLGYVTESGAERTIASLTRVPEPHVPVRRDGEIVRVEVERVVRGDLLVLQAGVFVAADARLVETSDLTVDESSLTGESVAVRKSASRLSPGFAPLSERTNMVYRGTLVTGGSGLAVVVATGMETELGKIQALATSVESRKTPMQKQLDRLGEQLALGAGVACAATMGVGLLRGQSPLPMLRTAVSLAVAAIPEGLPTVAITTLALGLTRLREERVIIRQLSAAETLGAVQVVCLDKTGTLTANRMSVVAAYAALTPYRVSSGTFEDERGTRASVDDPDLARLLEAAVLCNEVEIRRENGVVELRGSPTEGALLEIAFDAGLDADAMRRDCPLLKTQRRTERRNYMATLRQCGETTLLSVKGRPTEVLALCTRFLSGGVERPLGELERTAIEAENERMAGRALRVLGFAARSDVPESEEAPSDLVWLGLLGMEDPPRDGVVEVMERFHRAGVRPVMITGDQGTTALAIGKQVALTRDDELEIIDSANLDRTDPELLGRLAQRADVFSRVSPAHKLQIVQALQRSGLVVAMTGDGVNDGPALKASDIGIAMGGAGSNVAREVADVVLEDDELRTLVVAIEHGRTIYEDIRKAVHFILASNSSEILYTFAGVAAGWPEPLTTMQLLWINLMTDVFPELALAAELAESDVLSRPPRDPARPMFTRRDMIHIGAEGGVLTAGALAAYLYTRSLDGEARARSVGFTALTFAQLLHAVSARSETHSIFDPGHLARNRWLPVALGGAASLQVAASLVPPLRKLLGMRTLRPADWAVAFAAAGAPFVANEALKLGFRHRPKEPVRSASSPRLLVIPR